MQIGIEIKNKIATLSDQDAVIVCGNSDYVLKFTFDEEWQAYEAKTARFYSNGEIEDVVFNGDECPVPVMERTDGVYIGVFAGDLSATTNVYITCKKSILCIGGSVKKPIPDVYAQLMQMINDGILKCKDCDYQLGETEGTAYEGSKGKANADAIAQIKAEKEEQNKNIKNLFAIAKGNELYTELKTEQAYTTRVTADGEEIFDEQLTPVMEIKGSTVSSENLIHLLDKTQTLFGVAITANSATGKVTIKGTATASGGRTTWFSNPFYLSKGINYSYYMPDSNGTLCITKEDNTSILFDRWKNTFTVTESGYYRIGFNVASGSTYDLEFYPMLNVGSKVKDFQPYFSDLKHAYIKSIKSTNADGTKEDIYELPQKLIDLYPNGIPEYDRFNPQTGELIKQTGKVASATGFTEEEIASYDGAIVSTDNLSLEYKLATPTIEKIDGVKKTYLSWDKGTETVIQGDIDNSSLGAMPTITNEYYVKVNKGVSTNEQTL